MRGKALCAVRDERGAELAEAAWVLPLFILILIATVNLGIVVYAGQMASEAAREGVRMGSVSQVNQTGAAVAAARSFAQSAFSIGNPQVKVLAPGGVAGSDIKLRVIYRVPNYFGGLAALFPGLPSHDFTVFGEATMRQEGW